jgi:hypothetical protein
MGADIHMFIVGANGVIKSNIYEGRNSIWFDNISGNINDPVYDHLPFIFGDSPFTPSILKARYSIKRGYYNHYHFKIKYFIKWFEKYRPDKEAGWVSTYNKWQYENKGIRPDNIYQELSEIASEPWFCEKDWHFIEIEKEYDSSKWLYNFIKENKIDENADVTYCFDW